MQQRTQVFYDGQCSTCRRTTRWLIVVDWFGALEAVEFHSLPTGDRPVEFEVFDRGLPVRTRDGRLLIGFPALRHAMIRVPLWAVVAWIMYVPGIATVGRLCYDWFVRHRPGRRCALPPRGSA